jgi:hypothetical protein
MDTKACSPTLWQLVTTTTKANSIGQEYAAQSARWWPLIFLFSAFCTISGCEKKFPDPGEPVIAPQDQNAPEKTPQESDNR